MEEQQVNAQTKTFMDVEQTQIRAHEEMIIENKETTEKIDLPN